MRCGEVMDLLSAYYDGELSTDKADSVSVHVGGCAVCAAELETLHKLSDLTARLDQPVPPSRAWPRIAAQLDTSPLPTHPIVLSSRPKSRKVLLTIALLLLASLSWFASTQWHVHDHHRLSENFGVFLDSFEKAPHEAQRHLLTSFTGVPVEIPAAIRELKYRPVVADGLPVEYEPHAAYLLNMPCCRCLEACYHRKDGGMVCVFEHDIDQAAWFGERPQSSVVCGCKTTRIVQLDGSVAATWQLGRRHLTVIGARDLDEVTRLVEHFERSRGN